MWKRLPGDFFFITNFCYLKYTFLKQKSPETLQAFLLFVLIDGNCLSQNTALKNLRGTSDQNKRKFEELLLLRSAG
jgi:hypothetical protein